MLELPGGRTNLRRLSLATGLLLLACHAGADDASAQAIPREEYLHYVPLEVPRIIRQSPASARLQLYGDPMDPSYRDEDPVDGMDDARFRVFQELGVRFSPIMVQNTWSLPMDLKLFRVEGLAMELNIDTWNTMSRPKALISEEKIAFFPTTVVPCGGEPIGPSTFDRRQVEPLRRSDCRVLELLVEYDPDRPATALPRTEAKELFDDFFQVLWLDYPGRSPEEWNRIFESPVSQRLRDEYHGFAKIYVHPFVREVLGPSGFEGYEFILQYWFFYPTNDGGNNHAGDWEHINVVVSPRDRVTRSLTAAELVALIDGEWLDETGDRQLVMKRIDYYFHSKVMQLDFSRPNAYLPREEWQAEIDGMIQQRQGIDWLWKRIRGRAYRDDAETMINTHPVAYIGADNKGTDQIFAKPGGTNRDSHGTFPFPALFKDVGPGGATETIDMQLRTHDFFAASEVERQARLSTYGRGGVVMFDDPAKVEVIPDYERVVDLVKVDPAVRAEWAWLVLPIRFGYPAVESPFAGVIAHAETGNLSIVGPAFNNGWNRSGSTAQYAPYEPQVFPRFYQLGWQDGFINDWGYFNLTLPSLIMIPPFDLAWKLLGLPFRGAFGSNHPTMFPSDKLPFRALGVQGGIAWMNPTNAYADLFIQDPQFTEIVDRLVEFARDAGADTLVVTESKNVVETAFGPYFEFDFFIGEKFSSQNRFRFSKSLVRDSISLLGVEDPFLADGTLNFNEWTGFLRFSLSGGGFQPYIKPGYGISWFKLEEINTNGELLENPDLGFTTKWTWSLGFGFEFIFIRSSAKLPRGLDFSLVGEYVRAWNNLGIDVARLPIETLALLGGDATNLPRNRSPGRNMFFIGLLIGI